MNPYTIAGTIAGWAVVVLAVILALSVVALFGILIWAAVSTALQAQAKRREPPPPPEPPAAPSQLKIWDINSASLPSLPSPEAIADMQRSAGVLLRGMQRAQQNSKSRRAPR